MNLLVQELLFRVTKAPYPQKRGMAFHAVEIDPDTLRNCEYKHHYIIQIDEQESENLTSILARGTLVKLAAKTMYSRKIDHGCTRSVITAKYLDIIRPSGALIVSMLGSNARFKGIGPVKAQALWSYFGESLFDIFGRGDIISLLHVLSKETAQNAIDVWQDYINIDAMRFCNAHLGLPVSTSFRVSGYYHQETLDKLREDPYRLLAFGISFKECDRVAQRLGFGLNAPIRLSAAAEEALYRHLSHGSTLATQHDLEEQLKQILEIPNDPETTLHYVEQAIRLATSCENILEVGVDALQSAGAFMMETYVAQRFVQMITSPIQSALTGQQVEALIRQYENEKNFILNTLQRHAIFQAIHHRFLIINGGAGVGKTTVLDALYKVFRVLNITPIQVALAGKAAKRMTEATNQESLTIARFIRNFNSKKYKDIQFVIVIDESSMVDLPSMYRLLRRIPDPARIIMLGDVGQLPPVDFGLIFHELVLIDEVPKITLTEVRRQDKTSYIPTVATSILQGVMPVFNHTDVVHLNVIGANAIQKRAVSLYLENPHDTQIICATNKMVNGINERCIALNKNKSLKVFIEEANRYLDTDFKLNDKVMCTANLYDHELMNGSVGKICQVYNVMKQLTSDDGKETVPSFGKILWDDGIEREVSLDIINVLRHAHAMTVHKSQGSQFKRVIIVLDKAPNLDRAMCYTAITRAVQEVYWIGPLNILSQALIHESASMRSVDLGHKVKALLQQKLSEDRVKKHKGTLE